MYSSIVFLPLLGSVIAGFLSLYNRDRMAELATIAALLLSLLFSVIAFAEVAIGGELVTVDLARWIVSGDFAAHWRLRFDTLTAVMLTLLASSRARVRALELGCILYRPLQISPSALPRSKTACIFSLTYCCPRSARLVARPSSAPAVLPRGRCNPFSTRFDGMSWRVMTIPCHAVSGFFWKTVSELLKKCLQLMDTWDYMGAKYVQKCGLPFFNHV